MDIVPFSFPDVYNGLADSGGLVRCDGNHLTLEFQTKDSFIGLLKSEVKKVRVPIEDLDSADFRRGFFGASLTIRGRSMTTLNEIPGHDQGQIRLQFARQHRDSARDLASLLALKISEHQLNRALEGLGSGNL